MANFKTLDLNLLQTLDVLLTEQNVTRTAERLHLSQPAISVHLAKLRAFFGDPLLLPGPRGMIPTARAYELQEPLRQALDALERTVVPTRPFDPNKAEITWRIAASDYSESTILIPTLSTLRLKAPEIRLAVIQIHPDSIAKQAEQREIDLAFHISTDAPENLHYRPLFKERYVLVGKTDHPRLKKPVSIQQFCKLDHVIVSPTGGGFKGVTDDTLEKTGLKRRVVLSVPHFLSMKAVLMKTDLVAMMPARLIEPSDNLQIAESPVEVPDFEMGMLWHERSHRDPAHQWLREQIIESVQ